MGPVLGEQPARADQGLDLVRRAQAGDATAFAGLYRAHVGRVYAVCLRMLADPVRAQVLTQDTFVRAWQSLAGFRGDSTFGSWLHRVAVNTVLLDLRSERRRSARTETSGDLEPYEHEGVPAPGGDAMDLDACIAQLPQQARAVLVLHDVEGYRHDEIAAMMGIAPGTSKAHLHRARQLLRERLHR